MTLSLKKLGWRMVLVYEAIYVIWLLYALVLSGPARAAYMSIFNLWIGFSWTPLGIIYGAIWCVAEAWIVASVITWVFNSSLEKA